MNHSVQVTGPSWERHEHYCHVVYQLWPVRETSVSLLDGHGANTGPRKAQRRSLERVDWERMTAAAWHCKLHRTLQAHVTHHSSGSKFFNIYFRFVSFCCSSLIFKHFYTEMSAGLPRRIIKVGSCRIFSFPSVKLLGELVGFLSRSSDKVWQPCSRHISWILNFPFRKLNV